MSLKKERPVLSAGQKGWGAKFVSLAAASAIAMSTMVGVASAASAAPTTSVATAVAAPAVKSEVTVQDGKDVIVVLYHWNWKSIAKECTDVLGPKGYGYVQTSPPQESIKGSMWWTVYQPVSYKLDSKFGSEAEFKSMVETCNKAGVGVVADMVVNHMSGSDGGVGTGGTSFSKANYPGLYGSDDFHKDCPITNYGDRYQVQNCWLVGLQDLKTESDHVRSTIAGYFDKLADYGVAGYRVDAVKHIPASDMQGIREKMTSAKSKFWFFEIINAPGEPIQAEEYLGAGDSQEFRYAWALKSAFDGDINSLQGLGNGFIPSNKAGVFVDNHDTERGGDTINYRWGAKYKLANVFMLAYPYGSPTVHSGYEFATGKVGHDAGPAGATETTVPDATCGPTSQWTCTHAYDEIANMVGFHNAVRGTEVTNWQNGGSNVISFGRGSKGQVVINNSNSVINQSFNTSVPDGTYCDVVSGTYDNGVCGGTTVTVSGGKFTKEVPPYGAVAFYVGGTTPTQCEADTKAPTVPGSVKATADGTNVNVSWSASTDDCAAAMTYQVTLTAGGKSIVKTTTSTSLAVSGLTASTTYSVSVKAIDGSKNKNTSAASTAVSVKTGSAPAEKKINVYYSTSKGWAKYYIHYRIDAGTWTTVPGEQMAPACDGWVSKEISLGQGTALEAVFNDGGSTWDNNGGINQNYNFTNSVVAVNNGTVTTTSPCATSGTDTKAPTVPGSLKVTQTTQSAATVSWTASTDNVGVAAYVITRTGGGDTVTTAIHSSKTSLNVSGLKSGVEYRFVVRARDAAGNISGSASSTFKIAGDTKAPTVPGSLKANQVNATTAALSWTASTDNVGVAAYVITRTGGGDTVTTAIHSSKTSLTVTGLKAGVNYRFLVRARDAAGNVSAAASSTVTLIKDVTAPTVPGGLKAVQVSATAVDLSWKASSDNVGVAAYVVTRTGDGKTVNTVVNGSKTALSVAGLKSGVKYRFIVRARDAAGNVSVAASVYHTPVVDKTAPSKPTSLNATQLSTTSVKLAWKAATDNVGVVAYDVVQVSQDGVVVAKRIDGSSLSHTFTGLTKGKSYKLQVRARDAAGNVSAYAVIPVTVS